MKTTNEYVDEIAKRYAWSDYKIAQQLGITRQAISKYRNDGVAFSDEICLKVAKLLNIDPEKIVFDIQAERAKSQTMKNFWGGLSRTAGIILLSVFIYDVHPSILNIANSSIEQFSVFSILC